MPDAASDVKAQVEEDGEEPWREVQNGEKDENANNPCLVEGKVRGQNRVPRHFGTLLFN